MQSPIRSYAVFIFSLCSYCLVCLFSIPINVCVLFPGAILVAVAVGRFAPNRSPPEVGGPIRSPLACMLQAHEFGGDQGGERPMAEAAGAREHSPGTPFLELELE